MAWQQKISARRLNRKVGTRQQVIIDEVGPTVLQGRSKATRLGIDGAVYLSSRRPLRVGEIVTAKIERADSTISTAGWLPASNILYRHRSSAISGLRVNRAREARMAGSKQQSHGQIYEIQRCSPPVSGAVVASAKVRSDWML
jgi:hypothetical protein